MNYELLGNGCPHTHWHLYPRVKGDTPIISSVYQLSNEELFDESTRPNEEQRKELKEKIRNGTRVELYELSINIKGGSIIVKIKI